MKLEREMLIRDIPSLLNDAVIKQMEKTANKLDHGKVEVTIANIRRTRSTGDRSQNHHINGHCQQIAMELGWDFEDVKKYVKQRAIGMGYPILYKNGVAALDPWGNTMGISESNASVSDAVCLIDAAHLVAAENGIRLREGGNDEE